MMKKALTIAGFDPSGGAGIQADLKVFNAFGVYGLSVAASLTAQNTKGVNSSIAVDAQFVKKQLSVLLSDIKPDAVKIGMLYSKSNVDAVAEIIRKFSLKNIVLDPVLVSSSGKPLAANNMRLTLIRKLFPLCTVVTPNIYEASVLSGIQVKDKNSMEKSAIHLNDYGAKNVIITGGHLEKTAIDIFYNGKFHYLKGRKIKGEYHGTGCVFSSAITALLAKGESAHESARLAKNFMNKALRKSFCLGKGMMILDI